MVTYRIDTTTLREVPQDVGATWEHVERLEAGGEAGDGGPAVPSGAWRPMLRLSHVLHWRGRLDDADRLVDAVRRAAGAAHDAPGAGEAVRRDCASVLAFADQGQGRARYDAGRYAEAEALFASALDRRTREGAPSDQVESSRISLAAARARRAEGAATL
ncbi:hypothetical protein [Cellulomonas sp. B6]|uniref:hypothetical protein n=1 Tax=Cellulomonas sp. B6 TaxID=1295626 RepID=UPI00073CC9E6|nr:hypothetical protein [Cellulomonas sp. B6]KSW29025.1 hypothetical protein ATM99_10120 [Cellulomonas sp. B6]